MNNKYQEALDRLAWVAKQIGLQGFMGFCTNKDHETIQELIDNQSKLEKALDNACMYLEIKSSECIEAFVLKEVTTGEITFSNKTKEQWKEWLLK